MSSRLSRALAAGATLPPILLDIQAARLLFPRLKSVLSRNGAERRARHPGHLEQGSFRRGAAAVDRKPRLQPKSENRGFARSVGWRRRLRNALKIAACRGTLSGRQDT
jgi:hypothetical protein